MTSSDDILARTYQDLSTAELVEIALHRQEGLLTSRGALATRTGTRTGRSPGDRFIVEEPSTADGILWGTGHRSFAKEAFDNLWERVYDYLGARNRFVTHLHAGHHPEHYTPLRVTCETAWHSLFARNLFITPERYNPLGKEAWKILHAPGFICDPKRDGTASDGATIINFARRKVLIAGMAYGGELKKAVFTVMNFLLPEKNVLPMQCAANRGQNGSVALFFGLTGTGKTSLAMDRDRTLIGDDEHGWSREGIFNLEGGCHARTAHLSREQEPRIWDAIRFGTIVENIQLDTERNPDFADTTLTANGRCTFPLDHIAPPLQTDNPNPRHIIFLTCDGSGVLPPVAALNREAAAYHFLSGYSTRSESDGNGGQVMVPVFSTCFGAPFMPRPALDYSELLIRRIAEAGSKVYLVNSGWQGGPGGSAGEGQRYPMATTRAIVSAITSGQLDDAETTLLAPLNLAIPRRVPGLDSQLLNPRNSWRDGAAWDTAARQLAQLFADNIARFDVPTRVQVAGPQSE